MNPRWRVAAFLDRWRNGWYLQRAACRVLGHEPIPSAAWHVQAEGMRCAYCGCDL